MEINLSKHCAVISNNMRPPCVCMFNIRYLYMPAQVPDMLDQIRHNPLPVVKPASENWTFARRGRWDQVRDEIIANNKQQQASQTTAERCQSTLYCIESQLEVRSALNRIHNVYVSLYLILYTSNHRRRRYNTEQYSVAPPWQPQHLPQSRCCPRSHHRSIRNEEDCWGLLPLPIELPLDPAPILLIPLDPLRPIPTEEVLVMGLVDPSMLIPTPLPSTHFNIKGKI